MEGTSVEELMAPNCGIGVLGQSANGPGVWGHGGPLGSQTSPVGGPVVPIAGANSQPGGWFSAGRLQNQTLEQLDVPGEQPVSLDALPQLRLTPSVSNEKPGSPMVGDFFLTVGAGGNMHAAQLFICTGYQAQKVGPPQPVWLQLV